MTIQQKAKDMIDKFYCGAAVDMPNAKVCAIICVNEVLKSCHTSTTEYWKQVKTAIEKS